MKRYMAWSIVLIMLLFVTAVFAENTNAAKGGKLKGKIIVMIIGERMFQGTEFKEPKEIFEREGAKVIVACSTLSEATGSGLDGVIVVKPDILINDIKVNEVDAVVFVGGFGSSEYFDNPVAHKIAKQTLDQGKIIAAICIAPVILANAGLLQGKKATCGQSHDIEIKGAIATHKDVERDGNIITASGVGAATKFGETMVQALSE